VRLQSVVIPCGRGAINSTAIRAINVGGAGRRRLSNTIKGQAPRTVETGRLIYVPRGTVHRNQNMSTARALDRAQHHLTRACANRTGAELDSHSPWPGYVLRA